MAAPSKFSPALEKPSSHAVGVASVTQLTATLAEYLSPAELKKIKEAYRFSDGELAEKESYQKIL